MEQITRFRRCAAINIESSRTGRTKFDTIQNNRSYLFVRKSSTIVNFAGGLFHIKSVINVTVCDIKSNTRCLISSTCCCVSSTRKAKEGCIQSNTSISRVNRNCFSITSNSYTHSDCHR